MVFLLLAAILCVSSQQTLVEDTNLLLPALRRRLQSTYNKFKSYANVPAGQRPPQYSAKKLQHDISEYLTTSQVMMKTNREGPVSAFNAMTGTWSGFTDYKNLGLSVAVPAPAPATTVSAAPKAATPSLRGSLAANSMAVSPADAATKASATKTAAAKVSAILATKTATSAVAGKALKQIPLGNRSTGLSG